MATFSDKTVGKLSSLAILAVGLAVGFACGVMYHPQTVVQAQAVTPPAPNFQDVAPSMTVPSLGTNLILAHEIAADRVTINGYDLMKLQNGILKYLASRPLAETADIQNIVNAAQADTIYRVKIPTPPAKAPDAPEKKP